MEKIKSYKAFDKDFKCRGFQYEIGKEYKMDGIEICQRGFHACENSLDVWTYYDLTASRFAEVEQSGDIQREDNTTKVCSSKIEIKAELSLAEIIKAGIEWIQNKAKIGEDCSENDNGKGSVQIGSSGNLAQIASSGDYTKIASSGYRAQIGSSGDSARIGSSGDYTKIASSGYGAQIGSSSNGANIGSSGYNAQIGSSGYNAQIGCSGNSAKIGCSGDSAQIGCSGDSAQIGSSGYRAKINSTGEDSVIMCAGHNSSVKAKVGSWFTLAEWKYNDEEQRYVPKCVKTFYVDGEIVKADTWYKLVDGELKEEKM